MYTTPPQTKTIIDGNPEVIPPSRFNQRKKHRNTSGSTGKIMAGAALAVGLALGGSELAKRFDSPSAHPAPETVQPGKTFGQYVSLSRAYYLTQRPDLSGLPDDVLLSLAQGRARLMMYADQLQNGSLSLEKFLGFIRSPEKIIADKNTKLDIHHDFPTSLKNAVISEYEIEFFTDQDLPNEILGSPVVRDAFVNGDSLEFVVTGNLASLNTGNKYSPFSHLEGEKEPMGTKEYMFKVKILPKK